MSRLKALGPGWEPLISRAAAAFDQAVDANALARLRAWLDAIASWNARVDLTAARSKEELVDLMVADALLISAHSPENARVVDVGTGAGAPGLALALLRPDLDLTLVEPLQKRVAFLRTVIGTLAASNVQVIRDRGQSLADRGERFDIALARATLPPPAWLALGVRLIVPAGAVWVLLAREAPPALPDLRIDLDETYRWPLTGAERRAVRYGAEPGA